MSFQSLGLRDSLLRTLASLGYEAPTPIQERTIPVLLAGKDLIGQAQTGTGKTAAFALPILEKIDGLKKIGVDHACALMIPADSMAEFEDQVEWFAKTVLA